MLRSDLADDFPTIIEKVVVWYDNQHLEYRCSYLMVDIMEHTELRENFAPLSVKVIKLQDNAMFQKRIEEWPVGALDKLIQCVRKQEYAKTAIDQNAQTYEVVKFEPVMRSVPARVKQPKRIKSPARTAPSQQPKVKKKVIPALPKAAFIMRKSVVALAKELKMTYLEAHEEFGNLTDKDIVALYREMKDFEVTDSSTRFSL